ncbi:MAG TPA: TIGR00269 family protein [Methanocorpusculum sp.]|nr:TIGR00269 family protein [Candidatus Methanocorpusculum equi]MCQ2357968.1 TIGR00269 family protein [Methanocorpusculum sp.]HJJ33475.1 TIGR00269 family protein [Methanocorpusculum sp.]HJJ45109.1 TIGR00269 family protein [Methanocorpusculum sp.]
MGRCSICGRPAAFAAEDGPLCAKHFTEWFEKRVRETILKYRMAEPGMRLCVGFSGGKDSTVLLTVLAKLLPETELIAVTVDEGISGYRDDTIAEAKRTVQALGVEHRILSFPGFCGKTLDELLEKHPEGACSVCGTLRRRILNTAAREMDADRIATGHCLDDEAQSIVMNYLRGDITRVTGQFNSNSADFFIPRIKPLCRSTERSVVAYGLVNKLLRPLHECPYTKYALRRDVRTWLGEQEYEHPGTLLKIAEGQEELLSRIQEKKEPKMLLHPCEICGEPTGNRICAACEKLNKILNE